MTHRRLPSSPCPSPALSRVCELKEQVIQLRARAAEASEMIERGQRLKKETGLELAAVEAALAAAVTAPVAGGVDPTLWLPDELMLLILLHLGYLEGVCGVCTRWKRLATDKTLPGSLWMTRWQDCAAESRDPAALSIYTGYCFALAVAPSVGDVDAAVYIGSGNKINVFHDAKGGLLRTLTGHSESVRCLTVCPDGRVYYGSDDKTIRGWCGANGHEVQTLRCDGFLYALAATNTWVFSYENAGLFNIRVWSRAEGTQVHTLFGHRDIIHSLVISKGMLYSGSADKTIGVWSASSLELLRSIDTQCGPVDALAVGSDGTLFFSTHDCDVHVRTRVRFDWEPGNDASSTLHGHTSRVIALAIGPDGFLLSGSSDGMVKLWRSTADIPLLEVGPLGGRVSGIGVSQSGRLYMTTTVGQILRW